MVQLETNKPFRSINTNSMLLAEHSDCENTIFCRDLHAMSRHQHTSTPFRLSPPLHRGLCIQHDVCFNVMNTEVEFLSIFERKSNSPIHPSTTSHLRKAITYNSPQWLHHRAHTLQQYLTTTMSSKPLHQPIPRLQHHHH